MCIAALQGQNIQVASGVLNQQPMNPAGPFEVAVQTLGRLAEPDEFSEIVVKRTPAALVRLKDVARVELAAQDYTTNSYLDRDPAVALAIYQRPGSNALATAKGVIDTMNVVAQRFPSGVKYAIVYNPTQFIQQSVDAVIETIGEAIVLVVLVVIVFLQTWRAAVIPIVAIPVSLIGTFFFMGIFGFTLNNLSLFGLVLAIGIVVDDAIVVVENVERNIAAGLSPHDAAVKSMDEVGGALIAIALVLCAVFVPAAFITGISGQFYRQFALTIAGATVISLIVSLTLSPAMCALLLKPHDPHHRVPWWQRPIRGFFTAFNWGFDRLGQGYGWISETGGPLRRDHAVRLCRYHRLRPQRVPQGPGRLHPAGRPRLSHRRGPAAAGRVAGAHRRGVSPGDRACAQHAGRRAQRQFHRLLRCDLHQCSQFRRHVSHPGAVGEARQRSQEVGRGHHRSAVRQVRRNPGSAHPRGPAAAGLGHRQCRRLSHDGRGPQQSRSAGAAGRRRPR